MYIEQLHHISKHRPPITSTGHIVLFKSFILLSVSVFFGANTHAAQASHCTVAVASNFTATAKTLLDTFNKNKVTPLKLSSASTGKLYNQIYHGAPYCVFLAADTKRPQRLIEQHLADANSQFIYAEGLLVLWSNIKMPRIERLAELNKVAIANPKVAPYGNAALDAINYLGLRDKLEGKLVYGENINQAFQFVASKNAQAGFIALAQVLALPSETRGHWLSIPTNAHKPIEQSAVLLNPGVKNTEATAFMSFLKTKEAQTIITAAGYKTRMVH